MDSSETDPRIRVWLLSIYVAALIGAAATIHLTLPNYLYGAWLPFAGRVVPKRTLDVLLAMAAFVALRYRHLGPRAGRALAWIGTAVSVTLLLATTPFTTGAAHFRAALANIGVLVSLIAYLIPGLMTLRTPSVLERLGTIGVAVVFMLLLGEAVFSAAPSSHAVGYTLSAKLWNERYWKPLNPAGYRDLDRRELPGRPVFLLGDSFVAGVGITDIDDRISNLLDRRLMPKYKMYNLGWRGSDTRDEYRRLLEQTEQPAGVVLVYYTNDIIDACKEAGFVVPTWKPYSDLPPLVRAVVQRSYLLDFLYWCFPHGDLGGFESSLDSCYTRPSALAGHLRDLDEFVEFSRERHVPLIVVIFPHLANAEPTRRLIDPVVRFFRQRGVPVLDVYPLIAGLSIPQRIVNRNDAHPSVLVNRLVADSLVPMLARAIH